MESGFILKADWHMGFDCRPQIPDDANGKYELLRMPFELHAAVKNPAMRANDVGDSVRWLPFYHARAYWLRGLSFAIKSGL